MANAYATFCFAAIEELEFEVKELEVAIGSGVQIFQTMNRMKFHILMNNRSFVHFASNGIASR